MDAGVQISVFIAGTEYCAHAALNLAIDGIDGRQTEGGDEGSEESRTWQVDPFGEDAAENGKADPAAIENETREERVAF